MAGFANDTVRRAVSEMLFGGATPAWWTGTDFKLSLHTTATDKTTIASDEIAVSGYQRLTIPRTHFGLAAAPSANVTVDNKQVLTFATPPAGAVGSETVNALLISDADTDTPILLVPVTFDVYTGVQVSFLVGALRASLSYLNTTEGGMFTATRNAFLAYLCGGARPAWLDDTQLSLRLSNFTQVTQDDTVSTDFTTLTTAVVDKSDFAWIGGEMTHQSGIVFSPAVTAATQASVVVAVRPGAGAQQALFAFRAYLGGTSHFTFPVGSILTAPAGTLRIAVV